MPRGGEDFIASTWRPVRPRSSTRADESQQQRPRALVGRQDAWDQRPEPGIEAARPSTRCRPRAARRSASRRDAVVPPQLVARRQGADLYRRTGQRVGHLPHPLRWQRAEERPHNFTGVDDGPEFTPDGRYIYFNSVSEPDHADLADEAGRHEPGADHEGRIQQLVPAHLAGW